MNTEFNEVLIWDLDGVVIRSVGEQYIERLVKTLERAGICIGSDLRQKVIRDLHLPVRTMFRDSLQLHEDDSGRAYKIFLADEATASFPLIEDAELTLKNLKAVGFRHALLSNRTEESAIRILKSHNIDHLFEYISGSGQRQFDKPNPKAFDDLLEYFHSRYGTTVRDCRYLDDSPAGLTCAIARGIKAIGVTTGISSVQELIQVNIGEVDVINSIADLPDWLVERGY